MTIPYKSVLEWNDEFVAFMTARREQPNFCAANAVREWFWSRRDTSFVEDGNLEHLLAGLAMACEFIGHKTLFDKMHPVLNDAVTGGSKESP